ncbi:MAG: patatin-like protein, partial [Pseudomonadota bacterium]|nr:patatin-like protein [Pseudomonadota bacterium]
MREKELRLAVVCYGGISLAVYMHGITKEVWRLACASQAFHGEDAPSTGSQSVYHRLLQSISEACGVDLWIIVDILTGASAGGINAIFLAEAISSGRSLEPLTELWLEKADVDSLLDPDVSALSRIAKAAAVPFAWAYSARRDSAIKETVEPAHRAEIRAKLANFVRARWFAPPFGGATFTHLLVDAFDAMAAAPAGPALLPDYLPLDLFVTVTDFHGHPQRLRLHSPAEVAETEHRLILAFRDPGGPDRHLADAAALAFAARATASFPGAFPAFRVSELDAVLAARDVDWPGRAGFLQRALPRHAAIGDAENATLIDGSVLANAPFRPAIDALQNRPARREVDRRFVYIDPKPGIRSIRLGDSGESEAPGFWAILFGALSDIPREQPIRDNLETIARHSSRIRRMRRVLRAMRPEVEAAIERAFGTTFLLGRPTPKRLAAWRSKAQSVAAREAGYAYAAYGHLKLSAVVEDIAERIARLCGPATPLPPQRIRHAIWSAVRAEGINSDDAMTATGAKPATIDFLRNFDIAFRARRLRFVARLINEIDEGDHPPRDAIDRARETVYRLIGQYRGAGAIDDLPPNVRARLEAVEDDPASALATLAELLALKEIDDQADDAFAQVLNAFPKQERRALILAYLGYPFYDIATLPLLQGEGLDEFDPVKVDRISPEDATAIREGGVAATLKGIQFNSFGAFFSRFY